MELVFRNAPLVEIFAELRWQPAEIVAPPLQQPTPLAAPTFLMGIGALENFFHRFGGEVYKRDFQMTERMIPAGFPAPLGLVACRYRSSLPAKSTILYQVGPGIFTANATPPYRSWSTFAPEVRVGVEILLQTRDEKEKSVPFQPVSLRYIDAFRPNLIGDRGAAAFMEQVLGIELRLPPAILKHMTEGSIYNPYLAVRIPVFGGSIQLNVGEATVGGNLAMLLDTTFMSAEPISADPDVVMRTLDNAHSIIHDLFINITERVREKMEPEQ